MVVVLMGVTGSGKTTIGQELARETGAVFADADDYHSEANKAKMHAGIPLTDEDRAPWLDRLHELLQGWYAAGTGGVLACSALKGSYRGTLSANMPAGAVRFVLLDAPKELIAERLQERQGTYMNPSLLDSQLETLERPGQEAICVENNRTPAEVAGTIVEKLKG